MIRSINYRMIIGIFATFGLMALLTLIVHRFQYQRIASALLYQARKAENETPPQLDRMVTYLKRYLEFAPRDLEEKSHLAEVMATDYPGITIRARTNAMNMMDGILQQDPQRHELRRLLIKTSLELGKPKLAREHLEWYWADEANRITQADRGELELDWGQVFEQEKDLEQAKQRYKKAMESSPRTVMAYARLAQILRLESISSPDAQKLITEADELIDKMVAANQTSAEAFLTRWNYRRQYDLIQVVKDKEKKGNPTNRVLVRNTSIDAAEDVYKALQRASADNLPSSRQDEARTQKMIQIEAFIAAGEIERLQGHTQEARDYLEKGAKTLSLPAFRSINESFRPFLYWHLVNLLLDGLFDEKKTPEMRNKDAVEITNLINDLRRYRNQSASADYLEGRMRLAERRWSDAVTLLERARNNMRASGSQQVLLTQIDQYLGMCFEQLEEPGQMAATYNRILEGDNKNVAAIVGLASALRQQGGRETEAMSYYRQAMTTGPLPTTTWIEIARLELAIQQKQTEKTKRNWEGAQFALQKARESISPELASNPEQLLAMLLLKVEICMAQENYAQGDTWLREAMDSTTYSKPILQAELWAARIRLALEQKAPDKALAMLTDSETKLGSLLPLRLARVQYWADRGKLPLGTPRNKGDKPPTEASRQLEEIEKKVNTLQDLGERARLLSALAEAQVQVGNDAATRRVCLQLAETPDHQSDLRLRLFLFTLAQDANDSSGMESAIADLVRLEGLHAGVYSTYAKAQRLIWMGRNNKMNPFEAANQASDLLDQLSRLRPSWAPVHVARADVAQLRDSTNGMIKELTQAYELGDTSPGLVTRLARALSSTSEGAVEATRLMKTLDPNLFRQPDLARLMATTALRAGNPALAMERTRQAVSIDSKDYRDLIFLAEMEMNSIDPNNKQEAAARVAEARQILDRAVQLAPHQPEPYIALVNFLVNQESKSHALALAELKEAEKNIPADRWPLCLARCLEILGDLSGAKKAYSDSIRQDPNPVMARSSYIKFLLKTGFLAVARQQLEELIDPRTKLDINPLDRDWARNALAMMLAGGTDFADFQKALALVEIKLDATGNPVTEREDSDNLRLIRAQARVLATQPQAVFRNRALELFEVLGRRNSLQTDDQFLRAVLYKDAGNWPRAEPILMELCSEREVNPQHVNYLIRGLLARKDLDGAEKGIQQLRQLEKQREVSEGSFGSIELTAALLESRNQGDAALSLLRKYIANRKRNLNPEETRDDLLLVFNSLTTQERYDEAFSLLMEVWQTCRPEVAGASSVSLLRKMKLSNREATGQQIQTVADLLNQAVQKEPTKMVLRLQLADLMDQRGKYDQAVTHLQEVVKDTNEPFNVVALNNLAWILANNNNAEQALDYINKAINGLGRRAELLDTRGVIYLNLGKADQALADLKEANRDTTSANRLFHLARAHYLARDKESAVKELTRARQLPLDQALNPAKLHPREQEICRRMLEELRVE